MTTKSEEADFPEQATPRATLNKSSLTRRRMSSLTEEYLSATAKGSNRIDVS